MMLAHLRFSALLLGWLLLSPLAYAQLVVVLESIPENTPPEDSLFLTGSFNEWKVADSAYCLRRQPDGTYLLRLPFKHDFEYKFTRSSADSWEASFNGEPLKDNRTYRMATAESDTLRARVVSWEDMVPYHQRAFDELLIVVDEVPENTPKDANIYISGNFNFWKSGETAYRLRKGPDGKFAIRLPLWLENIEYKFTRGDWTNVEGRRNGQARPNRTYSYQKGNTEVHLVIESWEDLDGTFFSLYTFILIFATAQGFLLILAINRLQDNNRPANNILSLLILMISLALLARVSTYSREVFQFQPKLLLLPDLIFFTYGPVFLIYIQKLLTVKPKSLRERWVQFIPAASHLMAYMPLFVMDKSTFISKVVDHEIHFIFAISGGLALVFNAYYWWRCVQVINHYYRTESNQHSFQENVEYLNTVMKLKALCLIIWTFTYVVSIVGATTALDVVWLVETSTDTVWIVFSSITYFLGYFAMSQPEIFKHPDLEEDEEVEMPLPAKPAGDVALKDELAPLKNKLVAIMEQEEPYLNPKLTLGELADMLGTNTHTLSRVINEGFGKNFFDFINTYRVEAFKKLVAANAHKNQTLLGIALEVGFNSKTSFNRSFKKLTDMTPGNYLKAVEEGEA